MEKDKNKCSVPECYRTDTERIAWEISGMEWYSCPDHKKEVAKIVAKNHADSEKERMEIQANAIFNNGKSEQANLNELLEVHERGKTKKTGLFDF